MEILITIGRGIKNLFIIIAKRIKSIIESIAEKPAIIGLTLLILFGSFVVGSVYLRGKNYKGVFLDNILVEAHGLLFDIFIFGILIVIFNKIGERKREIKRYQEEIDDIRYWKSREAMYKIVGNIKRLEKNGITKIDLRHCFLKHAPLRGVKLLGATLRQAKLQDANLWQAKLQKTNFWKAKLNRANLREAKLQNAILVQAELEGAVFDEANLQGADLRGAIGIFEDQLAKVKTLHNAQLENYLMRIMKENHPKLFEKPEESNN